MLLQKIQYLIVVWLATAGLVSGHENQIKQEGFKNEDLQICLNFDIPKNSVNKSVNLANKKLLFGVKHMNSFQEAISSIPSFYSNFGGLKINADYLLGISTQRAKSDSIFIKEKHLNVLVDLSTLINGYTNISFDVRHGKTYEAGIKMYTHIFEQMEALGVKKALFVLHGGTQNKFTEGIQHFCYTAAQFGIDLYLCDFINIKGEKLDTFIKNIVAGGNKQSIKNLFNANNAFTFLRSERKGYHSNMQFPFSESINWPGLNAGKTVVIDAEYLNERELQNDISAISK